MLCRVSDELSLMREQVWFGEDAAEAMIGWVTERLPSDPLKILDGKILFLLPHSNELTHDTVGCGNGHLLFGLAEEGCPTSNLTGIDYSDASIALCKSIAKSKEVDGINWKTADLLAQDTDLGQFDLVLDKGVRFSLASSHE